MSYVATLISAPGRPAVTEALAARVAEQLPHARVRGWLHPGVAIDIMFDDPPDRPGVAASSLKKLTHDLRNFIGAALIDVVLQPQDGRRKKLLVADMDSTMIGQECIDELADFAGIKSQVAAITERAMRGDIAFEPALRERVALLKGLPATVIDEVIETRIKPNSGANILVATMRKHGAHTCLVSGGFSLFTQQVAAMIGFDENHANTLLIENGHLTGEVDEPVLGREAKLDTLLELARYRNVPLEESLAVGDGANDLSMIQRAGLGVAYRAKPALAAAAHARIDHGDLTALLYAQGYRKADFVSE